MDWDQVALVGLVGVGGAIGSIARYLVSGAVTRGNFPWGTFVVNFTGTLLLVLLFYAFLVHGGSTPTVRTFLFIGIFGGYTTFSTFGLETVTLLGEGQLALAGANVLLNCGACLGGALVGRAVGLVLGG